MNWLAHIFLSENSIEHQLGNLLADPLKGKCWPGASSLIRDGFHMHRRLDAFTDSNEFFHKSKSRLGKRGYLKGVIIDITYDHLLLKNWDKFSTIPNTEFMNNFYKNAAREIPLYPEVAKDFVERVIKSQILTSYSKFEGLRHSFERVDTRLSKRLLAKENASNYMPVVAKNINEIEDDFLQFFPELIEFARPKICVKKDNHWLR